MSKTFFFFFFKKRHFEKFINRMNGGYEMIWKLSTCIKQKIYCFKDFIKQLVFFYVKKMITLKQRK